MVIHINIADNNVKLLQKWASVSRTLNNAVSCIEDASDNRERTLQEQTALQEMDEKFIQAIDALHKAFQTGLLKLIK